MEHLLAVGAIIHQQSEIVLKNLYHHIFSNDHTILNSLSLAVFALHHWTS